MLHAGFLVCFFVGFLELFSRFCGIFNFLWVKDLGIFLFVCCVELFCIFFCVFFGTVRSFFLSFFENFLLDFFVGF